MKLVILDYMPITIFRDLVSFARSGLKSKYMAVGARESSHHYDDVIMSAMASQITSLTIACSTVYSDADQREHQSSASLAFVREIHQWPVNSPHKGPVTRKMFPFDDVIMFWITCQSHSPSSLHHVLTLSFQVQKHKEQWLCHGPTPNLFLYLIGNISVPVITHRGGEKLITNLQTLVMFGAYIWENRLFYV